MHHLLCEVHENGKGPGKAENGKGVQDGQLLVRNQ